MCLERAIGRRGRVGTHRCYGAWWLDDDDTDQHATSTASWTVVSYRSVIRYIHNSVISSWNRQLETNSLTRIRLGAVVCWWWACSLYLVCLRYLLKAQLFDWGCSVHSDLLVLGIHFTYWRSQETWRFILYNNSIRSAAVTWKRGFFVSRVSNNHFLQSKLPPVVHVSDNVCRVFARRFYQTLFIQDRTVYCSVCEIQSWLKQTGDDLL